jgi:hypothetical protein
MLRSHILTCALILGSISGMLLIAQSVPVQATHAVAETTISAQITGIRNTKGQLVLQLWNGPDGFPTKGNRGFKATNVAGAAFLNFTRQRFQRGSLRRVPRADNKWAWEYRYKDPATGKDKSRFLSTEKFPTQVAVERHLEAFVLKLNTDNPTLPNDGGGGTMHGTSGGGGSGAGWNGRTLISYLTA